MWTSGELGGHNFAIDSIEGASAVGKTITCREFAFRHNAYHIPEVNALWKHPNQEPPYWYFERQVERWEIAQNQLKYHEYVLLDGDLFQPLWYNWCYDFKLLNQSLDFLSEFYRSKLVDGEIGFPDQYVVLFIDELELRNRKFSLNVSFKKIFPVWL